MRPALPALAGGVFGACLVMVIMSWRGFASAMAGIEAGDWLQSASAIIGVALTIWTTLWLEERKQAKQRANDQRLLKEALILFRSVLIMVEGGIDVNGTLAHRTTLAAGHYELIRNSKSSLDYARGNFRIRSFNLWSALNALDQDFALADARLANEERILRNMNVTEPVLTISREVLARFAGEAIAPVDAALAALDSDT